MDNGGAAKGLTMTEWTLWLNCAHGAAVCNPACVVPIECVGPWPAGIRHSTQWCHNCTYVGNEHLAYMWCNCALPIASCTAMLMACAGRRAVWLGRRFPRGRTYFLGQHTFHTTTTLLGHGHRLLDTLWRVLHNCWHAPRPSFVAHHKY